MINPDDAYKEKQRKLAKYQAAARANPTEAEAKVKAALDGIGAHYVFQRGFLLEKTIRMVDFWFPSPVRICLEVDGGYHKDQVEYDKYREIMIKKQRKKQPRFVRITNEWVFAQYDLAASLKILLT